MDRYRLKQSYRWIDRYIQIKTKLYMDRQIDID